MIIPLCHCLINTNRDFLTLLHSLNWLTAIYLPISHGGENRTADILIASRCHDNGWRFNVALIRMQDYQHPFPKLFCYFVRAYPCSDNRVQYPNDAAPKLLIRFKSNGQAQHTGKWILFLPEHSGYVHQNTFRIAKRRDICNIIG